MDITFNCTNCGQSLVADETGAGITIDCPKCGRPVFVPSRSKVSAPPLPRPSPSAMRSEVIPAPKQAEIPSAIRGSLHCLVIAVILVIVSIVLLRQGWILAAICYPATILFLMAAYFCAIYGICHGSVKQGLVLIAGVSLSLVVMVLGYVWAALTAGPRLWPLIPH